MNKLNNKKVLLLIVSILIVALFSLDPKLYSLSIKAEDEDFENNYDYYCELCTTKTNLTDEEKNISRLEITIHEGKNRQVRKMCEAVGSKVIALHRSKIGDIGVKDLKLGTWRYLRDFEVKKILN